MNINNIITLCDRILENHLVGKKPTFEDFVYTVTVFVRSGNLEHNSTNHIQQMIEKLEDLYTYVRGRKKVVLDVLLKEIVLKKDEIVHKNKKNAITLRQNNQVKFRDVIKPRIFKEDKQG
tara:strand:- start:139 stop:498 length:360 start_codon:yes stop_codon:yes gene_type:complete